MHAQHSDIATVGLVGAGHMGTGIAQVLALAGVRVLLTDTREGAAAQAHAKIKSDLAKLVARDKIAGAVAASAEQNVIPVPDLFSLAECDLVIEAIVEEIEIKRQLFAALESVVAPDCILASNTSSLSITAISAKCRAPQRVCGLHFFNPPALMKVVEVISGLFTDKATADRVISLVLRCGHFPALSQDRPGFIVNHAGRGLTTEGLRIAVDGNDDYAEIDRILKDCAGFRMGPFELLDFTGLDLSHGVMETIYHQFYEEPRLRPTIITALRASAGLYGRKNGQGFYRYENSVRIDPPSLPPPQAMVPPVWISPIEAKGHAALTALLPTLGATLDNERTPGAGSLIFVTPVGEDASETAIAQSLDSTRVVAVDTMFPLERRRVVMTTPATSDESRNAAHALLAADGVAVSVLRDTPGFVAQRVVAMIVNIACEIAQQRVGAPADIDRAVQLGLGYPQGPLSMGDSLGPKTVLKILRNLHRSTGDPRYRPSAWLRRRAELGLSLLSPE